MLLLVRDPKALSSIIYCAPQRSVEDFSKQAGVDNCLKIWYICATNVQPSKSAFNENNLVWSALI
jgi:hypothetical protein